MKRANNSTGNARARTRSTGSGKTARRHRGAANGQDSLEHNDGERGVLRGDLGALWWEKKQLEAEVQAILHDKEALLQQCRVVESDCRGLEEKMQHELPGFRELETQLKLAQTLRAERQGWLDSAAHEMRLMNQQLLQARQEALDAERGIETMKRDRQNVKKDYSDAIQQLKVSTMKLNTAKKERATIQKELISVEQQKAEYTVQNTTVDREKAELLRQVDSSIEEFGTLQAHEKELREESKNLQDLLCQALKEVKSCKEQTSTLEKECDSLKATTGRVQTELIGCDKGMAKSAPREQSVAGRAAERPARPTNSAKPAKPAQQQQEATNPTEVGKANLPRQKSNQELIEEADLLTRMCSRLKNAAYALGGKVWVKLFRRQDKDNSGELSWSEFYSMCRKTLKLNDQEAHLRIVFRSLDPDSSGTLSIEELVVLVVDPAERMRSQLRIAVQAKYGDNFTRFMREQDKDGSGSMSWAEFLNMSRNRLNLLDSDSLLHVAFRTIDSDGSGAVALPELVAFVSKPAQASPLDGFYDIDENGEEAIKKATARAEETDHLQRMCSRLKAAAQTTGGGDWARLFREVDKDQSGQLNWEEFYSMCRRVLKLNDKEQQLRAVFRSMDSDNSSTLAINELVSLVQDPVGRMRTRLKDAVRTRYSGDWPRFVREQTLNGSEKLRWPQYRVMCRRKLKLRDSDVQLNLIFRSIDADGSDEITLYELTAFVSEENALGQIKCTSCGNIFKEDAEFCRKCGTKRPEASGQRSAASNAGDRMN